MFIFCCCFLLSTHRLHNSGKWDPPRSTWTRTGMTTTWRHCLYTCQRWVGVLREIKIKDGWEGRGSGGDWLGREWSWGGDVWSGQTFIKERPHWSSSAPLMSSEMHTDQRRLSLLPLWLRWARWQRLGMWLPHRRDDDLLDLPQLVSTEAPEQTPTQPPRDPAGLGRHGGQAGLLLGLQGVDRNIRGLPGSGLFLWRSL